MNLRSLNALGGVLGDTLGLARDAIVIRGQLCHLGKMAAVGFEALARVPLDIVDSPGERAPMPCRSMKTSFGSQPPATS